MPFQWHGTWLFIYSISFRTIVNDTEVKSPLFGTNDELEWEVEELQPRKRDKKGVLSISAHSLELEGEHA